MANQQATTLTGPQLYGQRIACASEAIEQAMAVLCLAVERLQDDEGVVLPAIMAAFRILEDADKELRALRDAFRSGHKPEAPAAA